MTLGDGTVELLERYSSEQTQHKYFDGPNKTTLTLELEDTRLGGGRTLMKTFMSIYI